MSDTQDVSEPAHGTAGHCECPVCEGSIVATKHELGGYRIYACPHCTLHLAPSASDLPVDYEETYDSPEYKANLVEPMLEFVKSGQPADHGTHRQFFRQVDQRSGSRLLDVGCGVGRFGYSAQSRGWDVTGVDVSARAVEIARRHVDFPVYKCDIAEVADKGWTFDVVTAFEVLEHIARPVAFLSAVRRVLRPGGTFFCTVPNWNCSEVRRASRADWVPPIHLCFFTRKALRHAAATAGLERVRTGVIWSDPFPKPLTSRLRWIARRLLGRRFVPLGLWMRAVRAHDTGSRSSGISHR